MTLNACRVLVTGGAGFIGSALLRFLVDAQKVEVLNVDKLTYAGNLASLEPVSGKKNYRFEQADVTDAAAMAQLMGDFKPTFVMHLAAESHVDRSIDSAAEFIQTNIVGTYQMLEVSLRYWQALGGAQKSAFRFHHISTDEVYGSLGPKGAFSETTPYDPSSPYSASKAASDHLVRAWHRTFGLPIVITNCSNNYGPYQIPEKLITHMIICALHGKDLPVYGRGHNIRDWLHVDDHVTALWAVVTRGQLGETYNIGSNNEQTNLQVVEMLCAVLDRLIPESPFRPHKNLLKFVADRPGHDLRYAIDARKIMSELAWAPTHSFPQGLEHTVRWYLENRGWWEKILSGQYQHQRLGAQSQND